MNKFFQRLKCITLVLSELSSFQTQQHENSFRLTIPLSPSIYYSIFSWWNEKLYLLSGVIWGTFPWEIYVFIFQYFHVEYWHNTNNDVCQDNAFFPLRQIPKFYCWLKLIKEENNFGEWHWEESYFRYHGLHTTTKLHEKILHIHPYINHSTPFPLIFPSSFPYVNIHPHISKYLSIR